MWSTSFRARGAKIGDIKMNFKKELLKKHYISKHCWVTENSIMVQLFEPLR